MPDPGRGKALRALACMAAPSTWTVMVYISGDNDLERYVVNDLEDELAAVGSDAQVQVVALADRGPEYDTRRGDWTSTKLFHVTQGMRANAASTVADWGEQNMGSPKTLTRFVDWTKANYPADHYAMYFWGLELAPWVGPRGRHRRRHTRGPRGLPGPSAARLHRRRGVRRLQHGLDRDHGSLARARRRGHELAGVGGLGGPRVRRHPQEAAEGPRHVRPRARHRVQQVDEDREDLVGHRRRSSLRPAADGCRWLGSRVEAGPPEDRRALRTAFDKTRSYWKAPMDTDLYDLAKTVNAYVDDPAVRAKGRHVRHAVKAVVLHEHHTEDRTGSHGLTIFGPGTERQMRDYRYYRSLDFAKDTHWDEFLKAFHS